VTMLLIVVGATLRLAARYLPSARRD
jgi:hypothetical protein